MNFCPKTMQAATPFLTNKSLFLFPNHTFFNRKIPQKLT